jgi:hypothetical protein
MVLEGSDYSLHTPGWALATLRHCSVFYISPFLNSTCMVPTWLQVGPRRPGHKVVQTDGAEQVHMRLFMDLRPRMVSSPCLGNGIVQETTMRCFGRDASKQHRYCAPKTVIAYLMFYMLA